MVDSRNSANILFTGLEINSENVLGEIDNAQDTIEEVLDIARAAISA